MAKLSPEAQEIRDRMAAMPTGALRQAQRALSNIIKADQEAAAGTLTPQRQAVYEREATAATAAMTRSLRAHGYDV